MTSPADLPPYSVTEVTPEQGRAVFDIRCRRLLGISGETFLERWDSGVYSWDSEDGVTSVAMLIPFARPSS